VKTAAVIAAPVAAGLALVLGVVVILTPGDSASGAPVCLPGSTLASSDPNLDREQWAVARTVIDVGKQFDVPTRGWVVALAAGMQESGLRPLPYGDRDSLGVFQQRTAWGSVGQRMNPRISAQMFFTGGHGGQPGLLDTSGWADMSVTQAAQAVQVSAYPDAYAKWEPLAVHIVEQLADVDAGCENPGRWVFPRGDASYVATAGFGECGSRWSSCHTGQDFAAPTGTPVLAASGGVVRFAGWDGPYGNAVHIAHSGGVATWYAHLSRIETGRGTRVGAGEVIGLVGSTGNSTGPHLHFEVRTDASGTTSGTPIEPLGWLRSHQIQ
jgi:murein DD-endopeptidase MepM/ murein hydrolase activator NlpD